jgi:hypothetical protein
MVLIAASPPKRLDTPPPLTVPLPVAASLLPAVPSLLIEGQPLHIALRCALPLLVVAHTTSVAAFGIEMIT